MAPLSPVGYRRRAILEQMCLRFAAAQSDFAYSRELDPEQPGILFDLGVSEYMLAHYAEAKTWLDAALEQAEEPERRRHMSQNARTSQAWWWRPAHTTGRS